MQREYELYSFYIIIYLSSRLICVHASRVNMNCLACILLSRLICVDSSRENIKCLACIILSRLICVDASRENVNCLACIYLNEYKIAVAAFTLHANDAKIIKVCSFFGRNFISRNAIKREIFSLIFLM